ncbi:MAG: hypothetical protein ABL958_01245 [Bdellovibrionia bacterium]
MKQFIKLAIAAIVLAGALPASAQCPPDKEFPHWEFKNGACLPSCGALSTIINAPTVSRDRRCEAFGEASAGNARDAQFCCVQGNGQTRPGNGGDNRPDRPGQGGGRPGRPGDGRPGDGRPGDGRPGDGRPGDGRPGDGRPGDGRPGDGRPGPDRPVVRTIEMIRISDLGFIPEDVCLDIPPGFISFFSETNHPRVMIDRDLVFCPQRNFWSELTACTGDIERPDDSVVNLWRGGSAQTTLSNQGDSKSVSITSNEVEQTTTWHDANATLFRPTCYERTRNYTLRVTSVTREFVNGREVDRDTDSSWPTVGAYIMKREPLWRSNMRERSTGRQESSTFKLTSAPYETQFNRNFTAQVSHTEGSSPSVSFLSDEFFSHRAAVNGDNISIETSVSPILSPAVSVSMQNEHKDEHRQIKLTIIDPRLETLKAMEPNTETTYLLTIKLEHDKIGDNPVLIEKMIVPVKNTTGSSSFTVEDLEAEVAKSGQSLNLDRNKRSYVIKVSAQSTRSNSKFVTGTSSPSERVETKVSKY